MGSMMGWTNDGNRALRITDKQHNAGHKLYTLKYLLLLTLIIPLTSSSQKIGDGVLNIYNSVGLITYTYSASATTTRIEEGTGTLMYKMFDNGGIKIFLITCKHILPPKGVAKQIQFAINNDSSKTHITTLTIDIFDSLNNYLPYVKFDPSGNDVSVIDITQIFLSFPLKNLQTKTIPYTLIATRDSLADHNVHIGDDILFIGYPNFFFNKKNISPIARSAIISTPPQDTFYFNDYIKIGYINRFGSSLPDKLDGFLIDGNAVGGSSGSLVFLRPKFLRNLNGQIEQNITTSDPMVLGIISDSYFGIDPKDNLRINLGGVISADAIKRTIDLFLLN